MTGYRVERCQGAGCTNFDAGRQPDATTFDDRARRFTTYRYRVRAMDASGNLEWLLDVATATTPAAPRAGRAGGGLLV